MSSNKYSSIDGWLKDLATPDSPPISYEPTGRHTWNSHYEPVAPEEGDVWIDSSDGSVRILRNGTWRPPKKGPGAHGKFPPELKGTSLDPLHERGWKK